MYARILQQPVALQILDVLGADIMTFAPTQRTLQTVENNGCHAFHLMQLAVLHALG